MRSDKWPIEIDNKKYLVDRTFGGDPVVYGKEDIHFVQAAVDTLTYTQDDDLVIIVARKVK